MDLQEVAERLGGILGIGGGELAPMTTEEIRTLEKELGCRFPEEYQKFLATYGASRFNGESPDNPYVVFHSLTPLPPHFEGDIGMLDALYGGQSDENDPYSIQVRMRYFAGRIPESMIPIGDDGGTGQICLGISGDRAGKIFYWDQLNEPQDDSFTASGSGTKKRPQPGFANVNQIAESFEDFLQRLDFLKD